MLGFVPSDAVLIATQAALVAGPLPRAPGFLTRRQSASWAWLLLPLSLGGTVLVLALVPSLGVIYAWVAAVGIPLLAAATLASALAARTRAAVAGGVALGVVLGLFAWAWLGGPPLLAQAAAVTLTALSCCALASYLAQVAPSLVLRIALVVMAALDAVLVFGQLLQGPNDTLNAATVGASVPHLQVALFGSALLGYGDLFAAAVLGAVISRAASPAWPARWIVAVLLLGVSAIFDLLFLVVDTLPATVPVAVVLLLIEAVRRSRPASVAVTSGSATPACPPPREPADSYDARGLDRSER